MEHTFRYFVDKTKQHITNQNKHKHNKQTQREQQHNANKQHHNCTDQTTHNKHNL